VKEKAKKRKEINWAAQGGKLELYDRVRRLVVYV